jgi:hypothetical protein
MRLLRIILILVTCLVLLVDVPYLYLVLDSWREGRELSNKPEASYQELTDATPAGHRRFIRRQGGIGIVVLVLCAGIIFTTRAIRSSNASNHAMQRTSGSLDS